MDHHQLKKTIGLWPAVVYYYREYYWFGHFYEAFYHGVRNWAHPYG